MEEIIEATKKLNQMLKDSREYKRFIHARTSLRANEDLYRQLKELKQKYKDIQTYWEDNPYDEIYRLCDDNDRLLHNSVINEYLRAESEKAGLKEHIKAWDRIDLILKIFDKHADSVEAKLQIELAAIKHM